MTLALIARAESSGLTSQTFEVFRNLRPAKTLVVLAPQARPPLRRDLYRPEPGMSVQFCAIKDIEKQIPWLLSGTSVLYSAETIYSPAVLTKAARAGVRVVIHANPELWTQTDGGGETWAPTHWELGRLPPGTPVVPFPVAADRIPHRRRERVETLFHLGAPAFHDRAGTAIVLAAAPHLPDGIRLLIRSDRPVRGWQQQPTGARIHWLPPCRDYTDAIPDDADLMLAPRRYGGLSLPAQEAAARGLPSVMTDLSPQRDWFPAPLCVGPCRVVEDVAMRGGTFPVYGVDPERYAARVRDLIAIPRLVGEMSDSVRAWALARSWALARDDWHDRLDLPKP